MRLKYNDYELLYLVSESEPEALEIIYRKYENLIRQRLYDFKIKPSSMDDFHQEGLMALQIAIRQYNQNYTKSFNKYFDLILQRRIIQILKKDQKYFYDVDLNDQLVNMFSESQEFVYDDYYEQLNLDEVEEKVYKLQAKKFKPREISKILNCDIKKVYNIIYKIKQKIILIDKTIDK